MQSVNQIAYQQNKSTPFYSCPITSVKPPLHSNDKNQLLEAIEALHISNSKLQAKQQLLQNTVIDLRKLLQIARQQADEEITAVHKQNSKLAEQAAKFSKALNIQHRQGNHLRRCALYWSQFCL